MKTQLLQDIDESHPSSSSWPKGNPKSPDARPMRTRSFAEQWREAGLSPAKNEPEDESGPVGDSEFVSASAPASESESVRKSEPAKEFEPTKQAADFAFDGIDGFQLKNEASWFDRWGRKVAMGSLWLAVIGLFAGAGVWVYNESKLERTLAAVAKSSTLVAEARPSAAVQTPPPQPAPQAPQPELVMLNEVPTEAAKEAPPPPGGGAVIKETTAAPRDVAEVNLKDPVPAKDKRKPVEAKSSAQPPLVAADLPRKPRRERAEAKPAPVPAAQESVRASQLALTLKQCRIEGYHAQQCLKRGCVLTKYGLACRG